MAKYRNVITQTDYGPVIINRFDNMIGLYLSHDGYWEKDEIELLRWMLTACFKDEPDSAILDVGAYVGFHTLGFARFPLPSVTVHAFEPQRLVFQMLAGTVALNCLDNVYVYHKAVSENSGETFEFNRIDYSKEANFGAFELEAPRTPDFDGVRLAGTVESVETLCIDDLSLDHVRLIKIDVEGMEHKVLRGAQRTISANRPLLFLEHEKTDFAAVKVMLKNWGYVSYYSQRPNILCIPEEITDIKIEGAVKVNY